MKKVLTLLLMVVLVLSLSACGSTNDAMYYETADMVANDKSATPAAAGDFYTDESLWLDEEVENQKLVYSGYVYIDTEELDKTYQDVVSLMSSYDARFENVTEHQHYKSMTIRLLKENFVSFYNSLSSVTGTISSSNMSIDDLTKIYNTNERKIEALTSEYEELKDLLKDANDIETILAIKDRLADIDYELSFYEERNENIDYDSKYSTLTVELNEVGFNKVEPVSYKTKVKQALSFGYSVLEAISLIIIGSWWLIVTIVCIVLIVVFASKKKKKVVQAKQVKTE